MGVSQSAGIDLMDSVSEEDRIQNRPDNSGITREDVPSKYWTAMDVSCWLVENGMSQYESCFVKNDIDGEALHLLTDQQLKKIMGHHTEAAEHIQKMRIAITKHDKKCEDCDVVITGPTTSETGVGLQRTKSSMCSPIQNISKSEEMLYERREYSE